MQDYLQSFELTDEEKERILFSFLKRVRYSSWHIPRCARKYLNKRSYIKIGNIYGEYCVEKALDQLVYMRLITTKDQKYVITLRGKEALKRGWVYKDCRWFSTNKASKYAIIISAFALLLTVLQFVFGVVV